MSDVCIQIEGLGKQYRLGAVGTGTLSHDLNRWWHRMRGRPDPYVQVGLGDPGGSREDGEYVWALRDVDLQVRSGEVLGIIGRNGAGKSTLLKILSRITAPSTGVARMRGRMGSLLEVGTGFHLELTGRENAYLNGAILGMTHAEVSSRLDEIIAFSGCERYIDTPVKRYSSGMLVRLAFAVAAHLDPEILVIDEVLAVGDLGFQQKCLGKMNDVAQSGRTVLFVSHNMATIEALCSRCIAMEGGSLIHDGPTGEVISGYLDALESSLCRHAAERGRFLQAADEGVLRSLTLRNSRDQVTEDLQIGEPCSFALDLRSASALSGVQVCLHIEDELGRTITSLNTTYHRSPLLGLSGQASVRCLCEGFMLATGRYHVTVAISSLERGTQSTHRCLAFRIVEADVFGTGKCPPPKDGMLVTVSEWEAI